MTATGETGGRYEQGAWGKLDPRWNMIASVTGRSFFSPEHLDEKVYREAVHDPWIVHFAGTWKPWLLSRDNPFRSLYGLEWWRLHAVRRVSRRYSA